MDSGGMAHPGPVRRRAMPSARPSLLSPTMLCGITVCLFMFSLKTTTTTASTTPRLEPPAPDKKCWIFTHLQKCGGSTVKEILTDSRGSRFMVYDRLRWKHGDTDTRLFGERLARGAIWNVVGGGYTEALRRSTTTTVGATCQFFTVFRHPVSRMVSAYFYCQLYEADIACATEIVRARDVDLITFAKHWSNFAVRQFALNFVPADDVMAYAQTPQARALLPESVEDIKEVSGWYLLKLFLERPEVEAEGALGQREITTTQQAAQQAEQIPDAQMYEMLQPVQALIRDGYAAVGILEEWNTTLALFDKALDITGVDWQKQYEEGGKENVFRRQTQHRAETLEKAWTDAELKKYMRLDLLLYEHAVDVFHQQARSHGLL